MGWNEVSRQLLAIVAVISFSLDYLINQIRKGSNEIDSVIGTIESIVEKVIIGETNEDGTVDSFKLTFEMKGNGNRVIPNAKEWFKGKFEPELPKGIIICCKLTCK